MKVNVKQNETPYGGGKRRGLWDGRAKTQPDDVTAPRHRRKKARERRLPEGAGRLAGFLATRLCWRILSPLQFVLSLPDACVLAMPSLLSTPKLVPVIARLRGLSG